MSPLAEGLLTAVVLAMPIAAISWTVTHEEVFREPREFCLQRSQSAGSLPERKFFYLFTCEVLFQPLGHAGVSAVHRLQAAV